MKLVQREVRLILATFLPTGRRHLRNVYLLQICEKQKYKLTTEKKLNTPSFFSIWVLGKGRTENEMICQALTEKSLIIH